MILTDRILEITVGIHISWVVSLKADQPSLNKYKHFISYYYFFGKFVLCFSLCQLAKDPKNQIFSLVVIFPNHDLILFIDLVN